MTSIFLIDGKEPKKSELLSLFESRDLLVGRTPFTTLLATNGKIPFWEHHAQRLRSSFEFLYSEHSFVEFMKNVELSLEKLPKAKKNYYLRLTMIEGLDSIKLITQIKPYMDNDQSSLKLRTSLHPGRVSTLPKYLKFGNYLEVTEEVKKAKAEGFDDCLFLDDEDLASECSTSNIFFRRGNRFFTPSLKGPVLDGVTRKVVLEIFDELGYIYEELDANRAEWESMEEVFITNSLKGLVSVEKIDTREFKVGSDFFEEINKCYQNRMSLK